MPDGLQFLAQAAVVEPGFQFGLGGVALAGARGGDGVDQREAAVEDAGEGLEHGGDDGGSAGRTDGHDRLVVLVQDDRGRDGRPGALAGAGKVRVVDRRVGRGEGEVGQLVVEQEATAGHGDAAAAGLLDGERVGDDVPPLVGHRQVGGALALVRRGRRRAAVRAAGGVARVAGCQGAGEHRVVLDQALPRVGEPLRQQLLRGYVLEGRVAHPAAAVGEGDAAGLDEAVQVAGLARPGEVGALQDVEGLADRGAAGGRGGDGVDVQAAVRGPGGRLELGLVGREVLGGQVAGAGLPAGLRVDGRLAHGLDDVLAEFAVVERVDALARQLLVRACQVRVLERGADDREFPAGQEQLGGVGEVTEPLLVGGGLGAEGLVHGEAVPGQAHGGLEDRGQLPAAPRVEGPLPGGGRARGADGEAAADGVGEGDGLAVLREQLLVGAQRRGLAAVDRVHGTGLGVVVDEVAAPADAGGVGLGDAEGGGGGDGRVDGVAALAQHLDAGGGGLLCAAGGAAAPTDTTAAETARTVRLRVTGRRIRTSREGPFGQLS